MPTFPPLALIGSESAGQAAAVATVGGMALRVVFADDNYLVREGVSALLAEVEDVDLVDTAADPHSLMKSVAEHTPDAVLTDIRMPPTHTNEGIEAARRIRAGESSGLTRSCGMSSSDGSTSRHQSSFDLLAGYRTWPERFAGGNDQVRVPGLGFRGAIRSGPSAPRAPR